jgi:hypothetical protein
MINLQVMEELFLFPGKLILVARMIVFPEPGKRWH